MNYTYVLKNAGPGHKIIKYNIILKRQLKQKIFNIQNLD